MYVVLGERNPNGHGVTLSGAMLSATMRCATAGHLCSVGSSEVVHLCGANFLGCR